MPRVDQWAVWRVGEQGMNPCCLAPEASRRQGRQTPLADRFTCAAASNAWQWVTLPGRSSGPEGIPKRYHRIYCKAAPSGAHAGHDPSGRMMA
jgi:hypothetical protein